jgi:hypothetical protein
MTSDESITFEQQSFLVADCGSTNTAAALFDVVEGSYRLIARAIVPTTTGRPWFDVSQGVRQAIQQIVEITGRQLFYEHGVLITPQRADGSGVDRFTVVISAAAPLETLLVGLFEDVSLASARRAMRGTYAREVQHFSLADNLTEQERVIAIMQNPPELIFLVGGTDGGADKRLLRLVEAVDVGLEMLTDSHRPSVLYAGNRTLQQQVQTILADKEMVYIAANVRPTLEVEQTAEAAQVIDTLYRDLKIRTMPGVRSLLEWSGQSVMPTAQAFAAGIRYLSVMQEGPVLGVDLGSDSLTLVAADVQDVKLSVRSDWGMGRPLANLLNHVEPEAVGRWLSFEMEAADIRDFIVNKSLFPQTIPATETELHLEQAIVREMLHCAALETLADWRWSALPLMKMIVVRGSTFANTPRLGQVALMVLDALQPTGIFALALDRYGILPGLGAAAAQNPLLPVQALNASSLVHLGHVIAPAGTASPGRKVMHITVESEEGRRLLEDERAFGTLDVLPLETGQMVTVTVQPQRGFDIGLGSGKGTTMTFPIGSGGLMIDARGRPLRLPKDEIARHTLIRQWLMDMGR